MNYQIGDLIRGIASGKIDEVEGKKLIGELIDMEIKAAKLLKPLYEYPVNPVGGLVAPAV